jgi:hypothetical protein
LLLNLFYLKLMESPLYSGTVILNPQWGVRWLERMWKTGDQLRWLGDAKSELGSYWEFWYRDKRIGSDSATPREIIRRPWVPISNNGQGVIRGLG